MDYSFLWKFVEVEVKLKLREKADGFGVNHLEISIRASQVNGCWIQYVSIIVLRPTDLFCGGFVSPWPNVAVAPPSSFISSDPKMKV